MVDVPPLKMVVTLPDLAAMLVFVSIVDDRLTDHATGAADEIDAWLVGVS
jgi:hypothetical protein